MSLPLQEAEELRQRLWGVFGVTGPFPFRDLRLPVERVRLGSTSGLVAGLGGAAGVAGGRGVEAPTGSYQWLLFDTFSGNVPAGAAEFSVAGPPIGFSGAITEVDVIASDPGSTWQMQISVDGQGSIFRTSQALVPLDGEGFFRPTPPGFWPETEGLVFPLPTSGLVPRVRVTRDHDLEPALTLRVLIVAHPLF